ncbi:hypothetical protein PMKS-003283 [Pichia membranifaciens]|uniref:EamA domain-containing protein n=1 Tax=Pichia membranifaciens TaxID=4926 RepID=A0A1Q2YJR8_9ASCO|nr:hypothetical protein PMKS-003283 [Pichia membranifaciens]
MKKTDFDHPLLAAYLNGGLFIVFGFKPLVREWWNIFTRAGNQHSHTDGTEPENATETERCFTRENPQPYVIENDAASNYSQLETPKVQLSHHEIIKVSAFSALLYFTGCFLGSSALKYTSASNQTVLATSSSVFSLIIGVILKFEKFTIGKVISVFCSMSGIALITLSTNASDYSILSTLLNTDKFGDLLAICGACAFSGFLAVLRLKLGEQTDSERDSLVYGYLGFLTLVMGFPVLLVFDFFKWERLSLPQNHIILLMLFLSSFLNCLSDYCGSCASLITSPLSVSLSLSAAIPITMLIDSYFYGGSNFSIQYLTGIVLIIASFVFTNVSNKNEIVETAIENAIEEAINYDEQLSLVLSPRLHPTGSNYTVTNSDNNHYFNSAPSDIPGLSIDHSILDTTEEHLHQRLVVTGGQNHKYFFREITD